MKKKTGFFSAAVFLFAFFFSALDLSASGKTEEAVKEPVNTQWTLCVTSFDVSALPASRQIMGNAIVRSLAGSLLNLDFRFRGEEESAYYQDYAWAKARAAQAKALAAKQNERDLLIYKGEVSWRYRKNLKVIDEAIVKLEEELAAIDTSAPPVEKKPLFTLSEGNKTGTYPAPPPAGGEYRFCSVQKSDAFLSGSLSEYHGRIYLNLKMYTLHSRSFSYEDSVLFSSEDLDGALDEISARLAEAVSDAFPSAVLVHAPPGAMVLAGGSFLRADETRTRSPGEVQVEVRADNHVPVSIPLELNPGELTEVFVDLTPLGYNTFEAAVPESPGSKVYLGGLYVGETPYALRLPSADFAYISVETPEGNVGSVVFRDNTLVKGNAEFVRTDDSSGRADFLTRVPVSPEEKRVDRARRGFYGAYGAFWFILPASLLVGGIAGTYINANAAAVQLGDRAAYEKVHDTAVISQYVKPAATALWATALGVTLFQAFRYLYVSGSDSTPIVKHIVPEPSTEQEQEAASEISPGEISPPDTGEQP